MTESPLQIAIIHQNARTRSSLYGAVLQEGHTVCFEGASCRELVDHAPGMRPDLVILQERLPDGSGIEALGELDTEEAVPVILVADHHDEDFLESPHAPPILAVLHEPARSSDLIPLIPLIMQQFAQQQMLRQQIAQMKRQIEEAQ